MRQEFVCAGFGGQGIILMGITVCYAAGLYDNKMVAQSQSYGPASRGGACRTDVIISDEEIDYAKALAPNVMILMSEQARDRYVSEIRPDKGVVIVDGSLVKEMPLGFKYLYSIPATEIAEKELGNRIVANMVVLGAALAVTEVTSYRAMQFAIRDTLREKLVDINLKALEAGYYYGKE